MTTMLGRDQEGRVVSSAYILNYILYVMYEFQVTFIKVLNKS